MADNIRQLQRELGTIIKGKKETTDKIIMAVLARGHVLLEDVPGVGKTTTALALCRLMGMDFNRIQFTPDVVPSDVTGFTMYDKGSGKFLYRPGAVMCNMLLADEINRTSSKTQSALLEVMEEGKVTVDQETHLVPQPLWSLPQKTQQVLPVPDAPESQLDRLWSAFPWDIRTIALWWSCFATVSRRILWKKPLRSFQKEEVLELQKQVQKGLYGRFHLGVYCYSGRGYKKSSYDLSWPESKRYAGIMSYDKGCCIYGGSGLCGA